MMFSPEVKLLDVARKQLYYKLKSNIGMFSTMIALQIVAFLFSLRGTGQMGLSSNYINLSVSQMSNDLIVIFTAGWAFYMAVLLTTKGYRNLDFTFVSNRVTSNLANIGLLLTFSIIGGLTSALAGVLLRVIGYFYFGSTSILGPTFLLTPWEVIIGITAAALYILLMGAAGYFIGMLAQLSRVIQLLMPVLLVGIWIVEARSRGTHAIIFSVIESLLIEGSLIIFTIKVLTAASVLLLTALHISNRLEVRK